jgi:hypothetical protein
MCHNDTDCFSYLNEGDGHLTPNTGRPIAVDAIFSDVSAILHVGKLYYVLNCMIM